MTEQEKREKVIKGLMCIAGDVVFCAHCKYSDVNGSGRGDRCKRDCAKDALALLKAQEPQLVIVSRDYIEGTVLRCPKCKEVVHKYNGNYCSHCGQAVKWE